MSNVLSIKADDWVKDVLEHDGDVQVDFWGNNCAPCTTLAPIIEEFAEKYHEQVRVIKINFDDAVDIAVRLELRGLPTLYHFKSGELIKQQTGLLSGDELVEWLDL